LLGVAHATSRSEAEPLAPNDPDLLERTTEATRARLGDEAFAAAFEAGRSDPEGTIAEAAAGMIAS
jgi:hypothetical protein